MSKRAERLRPWLALSGAAVLWGLHPAQGLAQTQSSTPAAATPDQDDDEDDEIDEVVILGVRRGAAQTDVPVQAQFNSTTVRALGVGSLEDVLEQFSPQIQQQGDGDPIVLINGRRISGFAEVQDLPPEAIRRVEIYPEEVALQYGYPPGQRVVNVVLRKNYRALGLQGRYDLAGGEGDAWRVKSNLVGINQAGRATLDLEYRRQEEQIDDDLGRTSAPETERLALNGAVSRTWGDVTASLNSRFQSDERRDLLAAAGLVGSTPPLNRWRERDQVRAGFSLNSQLASWAWAATGSYEEAKATVRTSGAKALPLAFNSRTATDTSLKQLRSEVVASGPVFSAPAGKAQASLAAALLSDRLRDNGPSKESVADRQAELRLNLDAPFVDNAAGKLMGNINARFAYSERYGSLSSAGYGLRWTALNGLLLSASVAREELTPDIEAMGAPSLATPNSVIYDFVSGRAVASTVVSGGHRGLGVEVRDVINLRLQAQPMWSPGLTVSSEYSDIRAKNQASGLLGATPDVRMALPERFERRGADLTAFDARPISLAKHDQRLLRSGVDLVRRFEPVAGSLFGRSRPGQIQLSLYHTWRLQDEVVINTGRPSIDLLDGGAIGRRGGAPRHRIELQSTVRLGAAAISISGEWESDTVVVDQSGGGAKLTYSEDPSVDVRLVVDLGRLPVFASTPWVRGRLNLGFENIFNAHTRVTDGRGQSVRGLRLNEGEGRGRAVRLTVRKQFR